MIASISNNSSIKAVGSYVHHSDAGKLLSYTYELLDNTFHLVKDSDIRTCALKLKAVAQALQPSWEDFWNGVSKSETEMTYLSYLTPGKKAPKDVYYYIRPSFKVALQDITTSVLASFAIIGLNNYFKWHKNPLPFSFSTAITYASISHTFKLFQKFSNLLDLPFFQRTKHFSCNPCHQEMENAIGARYKNILIFNLIHILKAPLDQALPLSIKYLTYCAFPKSNPIGLTRMVTESVALAIMIPVSKSLKTIIDKNLWPDLKQIANQYYMPNIREIFISIYLYKIKNSEGHFIFPADLIPIITGYAKERNQSMRVLYQSYCIKGIMQKNIEEVLRRGENIELLREV